MYGAACCAESSLQVAALRGPRKHATGFAVANNLVFGFPGDGPNCLFQTEWTQRLHSVRLERDPGADLPQLRCGFVDHGFESVLP
jgi:hypothetical protein